MIRQKINVEADVDLGSLADRASSGALILGAGSGLYAVVNFATAIVLARLLGPEQFGLIAMVASFTCFIQVLKEGGLSSVTIQKERLRNQEVSNLFWLNILLGACATVLVCILAPLIVRFYQRSELGTITVALSSCFLISSLGVQHRALLSRTMRFKSLALVDFTSILLGSAVGITMAIQGCSVWALVGMQIAGAVVEVAGLWYCAKWKPGWPQRLDGILGALQFGSAVACRRMLRQVERMGGNVVVGRFVDASAVGAYSRGFALIARPLDQLMAPISGVFIPTLSRLQGDPVRFNRVFRRACSVIGLVFFPLSGIFLSTGGAIAVSVLGSSWVEAGDVFMAMGVCFISIPVGYVLMWPLIAYARTRDIIKVGVLSAGVSLLAFGTGIAYGAKGVAWAYSISSLVVALPLQCAIVGRSGSVTVKILCGFFCSYLPIAVVAFVGSEIGAHLASGGDPGTVAVCGCLGGGCAVSLFVLSVSKRRSEVMYFLRAIAGAFNRYEGSWKPR